MFGPQEHSVASSTRGYMTGSGELTTEVKICICSEPATFVGNLSKTLQVKYIQLWGETARRFE